MKNKTPQNFTLGVFIALALLFTPSYLACKTSEQQLVNSQSNVNQSSANQGNVGETQENKTEYPNLKKQAEEMGRLLVAGDLEKSVEYLHPRAFEVVGGKEKLLAVMEKAMKDTKASGVEMGEYKVGDPTQIVKHEKEIFAMLPTETSAKFEGKQTTLSGALLGVSGDGGENWKFIRIESKEALKVLFPAVAEKLALPASKATVN